MELLLNEYENLRELGQGSFAKIYKVRHLDLDYVRAIRVLNTIVADENDDSYRTFLRECRALLQLGNGGHPNIVRIYQPRLLQNHALVEMDYIDGCDLDCYLKERKRFIPINEVMRFVREIAGALAYCHVDCFEFLYDRSKEYEYKLESNLKGQKFMIAPDPNNGKKDLITELQRRELIREYGIIHNDLHSKNIMRKRYDGSYILLDFGLAIQDGRCVKSSSRRDGAVEYKAPEKNNDGAIISEHSDVYSFGILMYEMLAGRVPFPYEREKYSSENQAQWNLELQHKNAPPPAIEPLRRAGFEAVYPGKTYVKDYPDWMESVILKCLEKQPENRYSNAKEMFEEIKVRMAKTELINAKAIKMSKEKITRLRNKIEMLGARNENLQKKMAGKTKKKNNPVWIVLCLLFAVLFGVYCVKYYDLFSTDSINYEEINLQQKQDIENLQKQLKDIADDNEQLNLKYKNQQAAAELDNKDKEARIEEIDRLTKENERLKADSGSIVPAKQNEINKLQNEVAKLQQENNNLKSSNREKDRTIAKKNKEIETGKKAINRMLK